MKIIFQKPSILILLSAALLFSCANEKEAEETKKQEPVAVTVGTAEKFESNVVHASGEIESSERAIISTRLMGFITGIKVKPGDRVRKGQLLATISNDDILAKRAQAQAMVRESEAALNDAKKDLDRYEKLYESQSASQKEYENVALHYNSVKAKNEAARQMQKEAEAMLAYSNLTAPFNGVVTQRNADEGSMANPGAPILVVEQSGSYNVSTFVSERDIAKIRSGARAEVVIKSTSAKIKGVVSEVSPSSQLSGGQYRVKIRIADQDAKDLYAGMYVHVSIEASDTVSEAANRLLIPGHALVRRDQLNGLYTVSQRNTAMLRWVTVGKSYGDRVEILSGLNIDEKFITDADGKLYDGVPVSVKNIKLSGNR